ncbi:MAG: MBL fold metallo-hydrolase [Calditrichaeota bacterium]|nr:MAG: MBL fold metallo-hydrolase [Calditrichota bacterium]MBL1207805.1 MBL fold metallo-hydrolase [Calditrichota bacterium]NOG47639.1 MBL fold metallo-hydrolase [Calditrichota bacterium]
MFFERIYEEGLAQASYFVGCQATKEAIVIDPKRDVDTYLKLADRKNYKITHVTETHIHADFLSGSRELASLTGAKMLLSDEGGPDWQYQFDHTGLKHKDVFKIGNIQFEVLHTPGHTPEHISFLLTDLPASDKPSMIFTGDFVFVGDIGRPDLLEVAAGVEGSRIIGAKQMFQSLKMFKELPDYLQVWPGHGAGSACGKALGAIPGTTIGYEKIYNWALKHTKEGPFVDELLEGQPEPPKYFAMMKKLNKINRQIIPTIRKAKELSIAELEKAIKEGMPVIDTRNKALFAYGHISGTINIQNNNDFSNWAGWLLNYNAPFVVIAEHGQIDEVSRKLIRVGLDNLIGFFSNIDGWIEQHSMQALNHIESHELKEVIAQNNCTIVDVRGINEYNSGHIKHAKHIHLGELKERAGELQKDNHIILHCAGGDRSSTACSILQKEGFLKITNLTGGFNAWAESELES